MRVLIEALDEHLMNPVKPIGGLIRGGPDPAASGPAGTGDVTATDEGDEGTDEDDADEDDDDLEEGALGISAIERLIKAVVTSPKVTTVIATMAKKAKADEGAVDAVLTALEAHLRITFPLALRDAGVDVQKTQASKAQRAARGIAKGKSAIEAIEMTDDEFLEALGEELEDTEG